MAEQINGWERYQKLVLYEITRAANDIEEINGRLRVIESDISGLKVKSGVWGFLAGALPGVGALIYYIIAH